MANNRNSSIEIVLSAVDRGLQAGLNRARAAIGSLGTAVRQTGDDVGRMRSSMDGLLGPLLATASAAAGLQKLVEVAREFDKLNAGLITSTGSAEGAKQAFAALQDLAAKTPYDLAQVTASFTKLVNFGLNPSERALTSYGNTSSALSKDLDQMIEAVADAATGEFERLKEFGIKASKEGDKVTFTFRGIATTVKDSAAEIEEYLIRLGEINFGDAMVNRMATLDGALSNLGDEWDAVFRNISQAGIGDMIADGVRVAISALQELNAEISSGELVGYLRATATSFSGWGDDIKQTLDIVGGWWGEFTEWLGDEWEPAVDGLSTAFEGFPENVRAMVGIATVYVASAFDKMVVRANDFKEWFKANFTNFDSTWVRGGITEENESINQARDASVDSILKERDATIKASADKRTQAKLERIAYEEKEKARKESSSDVLASHKIQTSASAAEKTSAKEAAKAKREVAAAAKKAVVAAKEEHEEQKKIAAEKLRFASQEKILAMELEQLEAEKLPTELARAEASLAIEKRISAERISLKRQELAALKVDAAIPDSKTSQADIIRAEADIAAMQVNAVKQEQANLSQVVSARMAEVEEAWRRGKTSVEEYRAAVQAAGKAGVLTADEVSQKMVASGDDMGSALSLGFSNARAAMQTDAEMMISIGEQVGGQISGSLASAFNDFVTGAKTGKEAIIDFAQSTLSWIGQIIMKQAIMNALFGETSTSGTNATGGIIGAISAAFASSEYADGGSVRGWSPSKTSDNIPAWLTAREFVQPVRAVDHYGLPFMERIRRLEFPRHIALALAGGTLPNIPSGSRLAQGGMASATSTTVKAGDTKLRVVNVLDKHLVGDYMRTADGETALINMIRRNGSTIKAIIG